ncbi:transcriptional regulator FeaR [Pseudovibrio japonicus]|uniref:Transcriptional regulator FeaR n=1 Tax=Pseudovibrio japonicus TaxID=366534 RepID=A0ABQ3EJP2_9HYPH|nr:helix-turn-helix domain-containing protein [Pseudovibrio japonicus]GHB42892.1 transcriptional regulator FeaR [Pseudovibrio japonicus]
MCIEIPSNQPCRFELDEWNTRLTEICGHFVTTSDSASVTGNASLLQLGEVDCARVTHNANQIARSASDISKDGDAFYFLILQLRGEAELEQNGQTALLSKAGDMTLIDSVKSSVFRANRTLGSDQISIHIPRHLLHKQFNSSYACGRKVSGSSGAGQLINGHLNMLMTAQPGSQKQHLLSGAFNNVVSATFLEEDTNPLQEGYDKLQLLLSLIHDNALEESFNMDELCKLSNMSRSSIYRLFKEHGLSCNEQIAKVRVGRFKRELSRRLYSRQDFRISQMAFEFGFRDLSTFNRAFRAQVGMSPRTFAEQIRQREPALQRYAQ